MRQRSGPARPFRATGTVPRAHYAAAEPSRSAVPRDRAPEGAHSRERSRRSDVWYRAVRNRGPSHAAILRDRAGAARPFCVTEPALAGPAIYRAAALWTCGIVPMPHARYAGPLRSRIFIPRNRDVHRSIVAPASPTRGLGIFVQISAMQAGMLYSII
uniref:Uncharacterized protein n=1 Tax=Oryza nivara TaxID=4536 RepID=A0A0E0J4L1_ORYNI